MDEIAVFRGFIFYKQNYNNNAFYRVVDDFIVLMNALIIVMILFSKYKYKNVTLSNKPTPSWITWFDFVCVSLLRGGLESRGYLKAIFTFFRQRALYKNIASLNN